MTITERRNHFFHKLDESCEAWDRVARDYAQGYETALSNYGQIKAKEAKQNKEKADAIILAASIVTGTSLMAAFATASLRTIAFNAGVTFLCNNNLTKTFNALHWISNNRATAFALGASLDGLTQNIASRIKDRMNALLGEGFSSSFISVSMMEREMLNFISRSKSLIKGAIIEQVDNGTSTREMEMLLDWGEKLPIFRKPVKTIDINKLSINLELLMHLHDLLDSDYLYETSHQSESFYWQNGFTSIHNRTPINQLPSSPKYPNPEKPGFLGIGSIEKAVGIVHLSPIVCDRIDDLRFLSFAETQGKKGYFFDEKKKGGGRRPTKMEDLKKAEATINELASVGRPLFFNDVRI